MGGHLVIPQNGILYTNEPPYVQPPALEGHFSCVTRVAAHKQVLLYVEHMASSRTAFNRYSWPF